MRSFKFNPDDLATLTEEQAEWWKAWSKKADAATQKAHDHWDEHKTTPEFNGDIWSKLKAWLLDNVFFDKCAYCECKITASSFGDAEHYRPKGKVTVKNDGSEDVIQIEGNNHPGYFWLAYNWKNLLPACQRCNTTGKGTLFPVENTHLVDTHLDPEQLNEQEAPQLLHPYYHRPSQHLEFVAQGEVAAKDGSDLGKRSIETYLLDRSKLTSEREERQTDSILGFLDAIRDAMKSVKPFNDSMQRWTGPKAPYSAAVKDYLSKNSPMPLPDPGSDT